MPYLLFGLKTKYEHDVAEGRWLPTIKEGIQILVTFVLAVFGWIIFRSENISQSVDYFTHMFSKSLLDYHMIDGKRELFLCLILLIVEWLQRDKQHALQFDGVKMMKYRVTRVFTYYIILIAIFALAGESATFIYFQF